MKYLAQAITFGSWMKCIHFPHILPICEFDEPDFNDASFRSWEEVQQYHTMDCQFAQGWHLERIQERTPNYYQKAAVQIKKSGLAYVIDTWVDIDHPDFEGRVYRGQAFAQGQNAHGTHVAGLITSRTFGVQKNATVCSVQVMDGSGIGSTTNVLQGLSWAYYDWVAKGKPKAVVSMSLGGGSSALLNQAVESLWYAGLAVIAAAGNSNVDACLSSPSGSKQIIVVGATDKNDSFASFSNHGSCVTLNAPGVGILSLYPNKLWAYMSGTSMATPIVTGIALSLPFTSPFELKNILIASGTKQVLSNLPDQTNNLLAFVMPPEICPTQQSPTFLVQRSTLPHKTYPARDESMASLLQQL